MKTSDAAVMSLGVVVCVLLLVIGLDEWYARLIVAGGLLLLAFLLGMAAEYAAPSRRPNRKDRNDG